MSNQAETTVEVPEAVREAEAEARAALEASETLEALEEWRVAELGRSGRVTALLRGIGQLPPEERPTFGQAVNAAKERLEAAHDVKREALRAAALAAELASDRIDVTQPGTRPPQGGLHPSTHILRRVYDIFTAMGFQIYQSRDVESDAFNFELLNMPRHHPARDMQDTLYISEDVLLRTHTSPGQIRAMREHQPEPLRIILPGMVYRAEQVTARSEFQFHQVEGLAVGRRITMADLKGTVENFAHRFYGQEQAIRFRASYFPFTEPSAEVDVSCFLCDGGGCRVCKHTGWLEIMGCGMVHPQVLENGGYDPELFSGYAFGMGVERTAMMRHGIDDIRHYWANDLRFLAQFR